ncbi:MAG: hypothetical protein E4G99_13435, partial [Anaerolineales bacterium]
MTLNILPKHAVVGWVEKLLQTYTVIAPISHGLDAKFDAIQDAQEIHWSYKTTILPPKKSLLPQPEPLIHYERKTLENAWKAEALDTSNPTVLLGVHSCDLHAIDLLDAVFLHDDPDQHYLHRRQATTIVSLECLEPCSEHAFCKSMGTLSLPESFDVHLTDIGAAYVVEIGSEAGEAILHDLDALGTGSAEDQQTYAHMISNKWQRFPYPLDVELAELPDLLNLAYESPLWQELGEQCLSCGSCNIVCPTCFCYDVQDEMDFPLLNGTRSRSWDSCQLRTFATVAGGHNFRKTPAERLRHRFLHKGKYLTEIHGLVGCVGCGRCAQNCLAEIS